MCKYLRSEMYIELAWGHVGKQNVNRISLHCISELSLLKFYGKSKISRKKKRSGRYYGVGRGKVTLILLALLQSFKIMKFLE